MHAAWPLMHERSSFDMPAYILFNLIASLIFSWKVASSTMPVAVGAGMAVGTAVLIVPVGL